VSRQAIAAALARDDLPSGERLVAFSLASFAGADNRAWPGAPAAAARAGLSRSRYLFDRDRLVRRGLVVVEEAASGRGRASTLALPFASTGPWWEGEINAELFEAVLSRSRARGPARLVLAAMAALADESDIVRSLSGVELCAAAGVDDHAYRRARKELLKAGELILVHRACGRGNTNVWEVRPPGGIAAAVGAGRRPRRVAPPAGARPLLGAIAGSAADEIHAGAGAQPDSVGRDDGGGGRIIGAENRPALTGVSEPNGGQDRTLSDQNCPGVPGVSGAKGGQYRTLFDEQPAETPAEKGAENSAENPAANARAGREPQNPGIPEDPPTPLEGGRSARSMMIEQTYITDRGRRRRRMVPVDLVAVRRGLGIPTAEDRRDWQRIRDLLKAKVGESPFDIWLEPVRLIAIDSHRKLVLAVPPATAGWTRERFGRVLATCASSVGRDVRFADEPELRAVGAVQSSSTFPSNQKEGAG
jgi:DnaA-like protein